MFTCALNQHVIGRNMGKGGNPRAHLHTSGCGKTCVYMQQISPKPLCILSNQGWHIRQGSLRSFFPTAL